jgi:hypothetical protein
MFDILPIGNFEHRFLNKLMRWVSPIDDLCGRLRKSTVGDSLSNLGFAFEAMKQALQRWITDRPIFALCRVQFV